MEILPRDERGSLSVCPSARRLDGRHRCCYWAFTASNQLQLLAPHWACQSQQRDGLTHIRTGRRPGLTPVWPRRGQPAVTIETEIFTLLGFPVFYRWIKAEIFVTLALTLCRFSKFLCLMWAWFDLINLYSGFYSFLNDILSVYAVFILDLIHHLCIKLNHIYICSKTKHWHLSFSLKSKLCLNLNDQHYFI